MIASAFISFFIITDRLTTNQIFIATDFITLLLDLKILWIQLLSYQHLVPNGLGP